MLKALLIQMKGMHYQYRAKVHKIVETLLYDEMVFISTDKTLLRFPEKEFQKIFSKEFMQWAPAKEEKDSEVNSGLPVKTKPAIKAEDLVTYNALEKMDIAETIKNTLTKIDDNAGYVGQANAINKTINTVLNIVKTEIMVKKILKGS